MTEIPLLAVPAQTVRVILDGQNCSVTAYQKPAGLFVDVRFGDKVASVGVIARDAAPLVAREYVGFSGNLMFVDRQGSADPDYTGLSERFALVYLTEAEYALV